jgi:hypothetical protein
MSGAVATKNIFCCSMKARSLASIVVKVLAMANLDTHRAVL